MWSLRFRREGTPARLTAFRSTETRSTDPSKHWGLTGKSRPTLGPSKQAGGQHSAQSPTDRHFCWRLRPGWDQRGQQWLEVFRVREAQAKEQEGRKSPGGGSRTLRSFVGSATQLKPQEQGQREQSCFLRPREPHCSGAPFAGSVRRKPGVSSSGAAHQVRPQVKFKESLSRRSAHRTIPSDHHHSGRGQRLPACCPAGLSRCQKGHSRDVHPGGPCGRQHSVLRQALHPQVFPS